MTTSTNPEISKTTNPKSDKIILEEIIFGAILDESHGIWSETNFVYTKYHIFFVTAVDRRAAGADRVVGIPGGGAAPPLLGAVTL